MENTARNRHATRSETETRRMCAIVRTSDRGILARHGCKTLASWGDLSIADIPISQLATLASQPSVQRIEAGRQHTVTLDTSLIVTKANRMHQPVPERETSYTGRGIVMGVMDIGFDLTHPTFYSRDMKAYRIKAFWDQLDTTRLADEPLYVGRDYLNEDAILAKAHATDGMQEFHGTHTASIAAGSGYGSSYIGAAPEAELCLVANAVSDDREFIP